MVFLGAFARIWEWQQPKQHISGAKIISIEPYSFHSDLHWTSQGYRIQVEGEERVIDFPSKHWDDTVEENNTVEMTVRKSFFLFGNELDGLHIDDHK
jgi:hypothetical protein